MPAARRFKELGALSTDLPVPDPIEQRIRQPAVVEGTIGAELDSSAEQKPTA
jgi:hypothetical protein